MTLPDRSIEKRSRTPWLLLIGLLAVAAGVVVVFASGRERTDAPPGGTLPEPLTADTVPSPDSAAADTMHGPESTPAPTQPAPPRADTPPDSTPPDTGRRAPIGDPAALPRPGVTLPRPERDSGARP